MNEIEREIQAIERAATVLIEDATALIRPWAALFPDWQDYCYVDLTNPIKVYFIRRTDGSIYATHTNRYLPGEIVIDSTIVHRFSNDDWSIQTSPVVAELLKKFQHSTVRAR